MIPKGLLRPLSVAFVIALFTPILAACGAGSGTTINVGTKDFAEEYIVGNMYKLLLEDAGFKVNLKTDLPTPAAQSRDGVERARPLPGVHRHRPRHRAEAPRPERPRRHL